MTAGHPSAEFSLTAKRNGFTLVEVIVVVAIMGVLFAIATLSWQSMRDRYTVEKQTKEIYTDMMNARLRAMQRDRCQFAVFPGSANVTTYQIYEDGPLPDGNGFFVSAATDSLISTYTLQPSYTMTLSNPTMTIITFTSKGLVDLALTGAIRINSTASGEYDCVFVDQIKTGMGKWNGATNACDIK